jgi:AmmeMemoRadiSam system protein B
MNTRHRALPRGWYPESGAEIDRILSGWRSETRENEPRTAVSCIVPHAGWFFSGALAFRTLERLERKADTVVIVGGHLPSGAGVLVATEESYDTPFGTVPADLELVRTVIDELEARPDTEPDNSTEVVLPMARYLFPESSFVLIRAAPSRTAISLGETIAQAADRFSRRIRVIGSTDLTHYGPAYRFTPHGTGAAAERWVKEVNDREFIDAVVSGDLEAALSASLLHRSACSAGAAAAAARFAMCSGAPQAALLEHSTSLERHESSSFVGYAGIVFHG